MPLRRLTLLCLLACLFAAPAFAYTIYLKDGSRIVAREKHRVEGDRAIITLMNGTQTFLAAKEIDEARTEQANQIGTGRAQELGQQKELPPAGPKGPERKNLGDLIKERGNQPREREQARRDEAVIGEPPPAGKTKAGFADLFNLPRQAFTYQDVATDFKRMLANEGLNGASVYQGTKVNRPLVELRTATEAEVFEALRSVASAMIDLKSRFDAKVGAVEIVMVTPNRQRAGQFELSLDEAEALVDRRINPSDFFMAQVQF
jgi:hypothetical protein